MKFKDLATHLSEMEGLKEQVSIGNIREVLRLTLSVLANESAGEVGELLAKYKI